ncbi:hypothetical protein GLIP_0511 [Aliiglaciecola lipolytica E3]|uniref:Uncharacterized protein n=1 Tax=Aliiglaciecola lipolytica E3 TaxID=1127673 RepID=K6Y4G8_9ALTE|nr:hypothetical protein GLIP_0511 [Aliiglaciecola lipolytica E3]
MIEQRKSIVVYFLGSLLVNRVQPLKIHTFNVDIRPLHGNLT